MKLPRQLLLTENETDLIVHGNTLTFKLTSKPTITVIYAGYFLPIFAGHALETQPHARTAETQHTCL